MNEFEAVMGIVNLRHTDEEINKRKAAAEQYWKEPRDLSFCVRQRM